jgi:hypothetical protein
VKRIIVPGLVVLGALGVVGLAACSEDESTASSPDGGTSAEAGMPAVDTPDSSAAPDSSTDSGSGDAGPKGPPQLGGCTVLPPDHIFNTPIANLPKHSNSDAFMTTIGAANLQADFGRTVDQSSAEYSGLPYNLVHGNTIAWSPVRYTSTDPDMNWDPRAESDCAMDVAHTLVSPCTAETVETPLLPIPSAPLVEGGIATDASHLPYAKHHMLILDQDTCELWETYHSYETGPDGGWDIFGSAHFDLRSSALRHDTWTSADGAGFPILPLVLRAAEANTGEIRHALRFTVQSNRIRQSYTWPARHITWNGTQSTDLPPMGQAFRINHEYVIPDDFTIQAKAILQALKTYGMYIADGGPSWYISGEPSADWEEATLTQIATVPSSVFEAVDLSPIQARDGFDANSAAVPPP